MFIKLIKNLSKTKTDFLMLTLEDLWGETVPQNMPGTYKEVPNWKRKCRYRIEEFTNKININKTLKSLSRPSQSNPTSQESVQ